MKTNILLFITLIIFSSLSSSLSMRISSAKATAQAFTFVAPESGKKYKIVARNNNHCLYSDKKWIYQQTCTFSSQNYFTLTFKDGTKEFSLEDYSNQMMSADGYKKAWLHVYKPLFTNSSYHFYLVQSLTDSTQYQIQLNSYRHLSLNIGGGSDKWLWVYRNEKDLNSRWSFVEVN